MKRQAWRTWALVVCLALSLGLGLLAYREARQAQLPDWIELEEGPVAHGVEKFYRNAYFKGNIETAGDATIAGNLDLGTVTTGTITNTGTITPAFTVYQTIPSTTTITISLTQCSNRGQLLILHNYHGTYTVTVANSNVSPTGTFDLGPNDAYIGLCNGADWLTLQRRDN